MSFWNEIYADDKPEEKITPSPTPSGKLCMCATITVVARNFRTTCGQCGGDDAYGAAARLAAKASPATVAPTVDVAERIFTTKGSVIDKCMKGWVESLPLQAGSIDVLRCSAMAGLCPREFVLHYWNPKLNKFFDSSSQLKMDAGTDMHFRMQNQFLGPMKFLYGNWEDTKAGTFRTGFQLDPAERYVEDDVWDEQHRIRGHLDGWVCLNRVEWFKKNAKKLKGLKIHEELALIPMHLVPWELKTLSKYQFDKMKTWRDIPDYYRCQASIYQWLGKATQTLFTLIERDTMTFRDIVYPGEELFVKEAKRKAKIVWEAIRDETLPDSLMKCKHPKDKAGANCVFHDECWSRRFDMKAFIDNCKIEQPTRNWLDLSKVSF